jgi:hypothetical protein
VQLTGQALALFEDRFAASFGEEAGVLDRHGGLVGDSLEEYLLVHARFLPGKIAEVDHT